MNQVSVLRQESGERSHGVLLRRVLIGVGTTVGLALLAAGGWWGYLKMRWQASLEDPSIRIAKIRRLSPEAGKTFKECDTCPEMVIIPAGTFTMGSPHSEKGRHTDEGPQRRVTITRPFAVSKYEITFDEWDACVKAGACNGYKPSDSGWGRSKRPVSNVSWNDAQSYAAWLSAKTGQQYRLLTEAEWEYAARAQTTTVYHWGNTFQPTKTNSARKTLPVGRYEPNRFGLYDMHGNVWEWVEDCYRGNYKGAPKDAAAVTASPCPVRLMRGGAWLAKPRGHRSAYRGRARPWSRYFTFGIRLARTL